MIDIVSKSGNLLLNIEPKSNGTLPDEVEQGLREVGGWLKINGEAIYNTRVWQVFGEGPTKVTEGPFHDTDTQPYTGEDFRFTRKGNVLYAIELGWPASGEAVIQTLDLPAEGSQRKVQSVVLLGSESQLSFEQREDGLHIKLPERAPGKYAFAYRIAFQGKRFDGLIAPRARCRANLNSGESTATRSIDN